MPVTAPSAQPSPPQQAKAAVASSLPRLLRLVYTRGAGARTCPEQSFVRNQIKAHELGARGSPLADGAAARLEIGVERAKDGNYWTHWTVFDEDGKRQVTADLGPSGDCTTLLAATALSFMILWDEPRQPAPVAPTPGPAGTTPEAPPAATPPATAVPAVTAPPAATAMPATPRPPPRRSAPPPPAIEQSPSSPPVCKLALGGYCLAVDIYSLGFSAGALMTVGFTANVGPGAYIGAEFRPVKMFSIDLEVRGIFPSYVVASKPIDPTQKASPPVKPDVSSVVAMLVPCFRYSWFLGCAVGYAGNTIFNTPLTTPLGLSYGLGPRLGVEIPIGERFAVRAWGDALFDLGQPRFLITNVNLSWKQDLVSGFFGAGVVVNFK
jgi:hypothetical protein